MTQEQSEYRRMISLALSLAREQVSRELWRRGIRPVEVEHKEKMTKAIEYLELHPELMAQAKAIIESRVHPPANLKTNAQSENGPKSTTSSVQISGAK